MGSLRHVFSSTVMVAALALIAGAAQAQVPPDIAAKIKAIGSKIDVAVGALYAPLQQKEPYAGVTVTRDVAYGSDPLQKLDVFAPQAKPAKPRPVLLFVHGGGFVRGDKKTTDNMVLWGADNGMVGVDINYRLAPKNPWPAGAQDLASAVAWTRAHIAEYGGDPDHIILWGHSAGANHVADYVAHKEVQGPEWRGVKGAIIMSPVYAPAVGERPNAYYGSDASIQTADAAIGRLDKVSIPLFLANAEYDPDGFRTFQKSLNEGLTRAGHPYTYVFLKDHDHLSEGMAVGTADQSLTGPQLKWIQALK
jgi:acetyl esterase/lipase